MEVVTGLVVDAVHSPHCEDGEVVVYAEVVVSAGLVVEEVHSPHWEEGEVVVSTDLVVV